MIEAVSARIWARKSASFRLSCCARRRAEWPTYCLLKTQDRKRWLRRRTSARRNTGLSSNQAPDTEETRKNDEQKIQERQEIKINAGQRH
jgi:hypothetical protein